MQRINLDVQTRDLGQKQESNPNQLRKAGWVPGILYGHGQPIKIAVDQKAFAKATHTDAGINALFNVKVSGKTSLGIIKEVQRDIFTQEPIHVDLQRINVKEKITVNIPIHTTGEAPGVKNDGGILEHLTREVQLRCLPDQIPPHIDVDVSKLEMHQHIKVEDLKLGDGIELLTDGDHIIVHVVMPRVEEEPTPAAEGAEGEAAEPEVISKGKKEEEGAEGEGAKPADAAKAEKK